MSELAPSYADVATLRTALAELADAIEVKASALANPSKAISPRMEVALAKARELTGTKSVLSP